VIDSSADAEPALEDIAYASYVLDAGRAFHPPDYCEHEINEMRFSQRVFSEMRVQGNVEHRAHSRAL
jgi:hypothetical protein